MVAIIFVYMINNWFLSKSQIKKLKYAKKRKSTVRKTLEILDKDILPHEAEESDSKYRQSQSKDLPVNNIYIDKGQTKNTKKTSCLFKGLKSGKTYTVWITAIYNGKKDGTVSSYSCKVK